MKDAQLRITAMQFAIDVVKLMAEDEAVIVAHDDFEKLIEGANEIYKFLKGV